MVFIKTLTIGDRTRTHGMSNTKMYSIWRDMRNRCYRPSVDRYPNYGGRGITVCDEWKSKFENFRDWAFENGYVEGLSLERVDVNGNYEPSNCKWIPLKEQARNRTSNVFVEYQGKELCLVELSEVTGLDIRVIYSRFHRGDRGERLWRKPRTSPKKVDIELTHKIAKGLCAVQSIEGE